MKFLKFAVIFGTLGAVSFWYVKQQKKQEIVAATLPKIGAIENFSLTDQENSPFDFQSLHGKVVLTNFFFANCTGPCPLMTQKLVRIQKELAAETNFHLLSITIDPEQDSAEQIKVFAQKHEANLANWTFLTGDKEKIINLSTQSFKLSAGENPDLHSTRLVLIDKNGNIRGYYESQEEEEQTKLLNDIRALLQEETVS